MTDSKDQSVARTSYTRLPDDLPMMLDISTAAAIRNNSYRFILNKCVSGEIKANKIGTSWRINRNEFLRQCGLA